MRRQQGHQVDAALGRDCAPSPIVPAPPACLRCLPRSCWKPQGCELQLLPFAGARVDAQWRSPCLLLAGKGGEGQADSDEEAEDPSTAAAHARAAAAALVAAGSGKKAKRGGADTGARIGAAHISP